MCRHGVYAGETISGDEVPMDCPRCEKRRDWADEDERDRIDELADVRSWLDDIPADGMDQW